MRVLQRVSCVSVTVLCANVALAQPAEAPGAPPAPPEAPPPAGAPKAAIPAETTTQAPPPVAIETAAPATSGDATGTLPASGAHPAGEVSATADAPTVTSEPASVDELAGVEEVGREPAPTVGFDKGFFIADGPNTLAIRARVQARFSWELVEDADDEAAFAIQRARVGLEGTTLTEDLAYKFQMDLGKGDLALKDFYLDYTLCSAFVLRAGQFKTPFSRQQITSSGSQELVDRALTDKAFGAGRDIGVMLHDNYEKSPEFEYAVGVFNGTGEASMTTGSVSVTPADPASPDEPQAGALTSFGRTNVPSVFDPALVARVGYNYGKLKGYSEVDFEGGPFRAGLGLSGKAHFDADQDGDDSLIVGQVDYVVKAEGFSTTGGFYVSSLQSGDGFGDRAFGALGVHVQAGYLVADLVQPVARFALVRPDGDGNDEQEIAFGIGVYPFQHNFKWQTDVSLLGHESSDTRDTLVRSQLQLAF